MEDRGNRTVKEMDRCAMHGEAKGQPINHPNTGGK
jgi:hypothetical protein